MEVSGQAALSQPVGTVVDSLHHEQESYYDSLLAFQRYVDEHARARYFSRTMETIRDDIDYAYAIVSKAVSGATVSQQAEKIYKEQESLDREIEMLEQEMNELEGEPPAEEEIESP
jgi:cell division protein FtsB